MTCKNVNMTRAKKMVRIAAMNISMSTKKLFMNFQNLDFGFSWLVIVIQFSWYCSMKSLSIMGACINFGFIWKESNEMGVGCLTLVQFLSIGVFKLHLVLLNNLRRLNLLWNTFLSQVFHVHHMQIGILARN